MPRPVALLDVDFTLLFGEDILNESLLTALLNKNIRDIYLFTDMTLGEVSVRERRKLINRLQEKGFTVHGVITPCDYTWHLDEASANQFLAKFMAANIDMRAERNIDKLDEIIQQFPEITNLVSGKSFSNNLAVPFNLANLRENFESAEYNSLKNKSRSCKTVSDVISLKRNLTSVKALMFELFIQYKPNWISSCLVFDDLNECLTGVLQVNEKIGFPTTTVQVNPKDDAEVFTAKIDDHFSMIKHKQNEFESLSSTQVSYEENDSASEISSEELKRLKEINLIYSHIGQIAFHLLNEEIDKYLEELEAFGEILSQLKINQQLCRNLKLPTNSFVKLTDEALEIMDASFRVICIAPRDNLENLYHAIQLFYPIYFSTAKSCGPIKIDRDSTHYKAIQDSLHQKISHLGQNNSAEVDNNNNNKTEKKSFFKTLSPNTKLLKWLGRKKDDDNNNHDNQSSETCLP